MLRPFFSLLFIYCWLLAPAQQHSVGLGIHTGLTIPVTLDKGMDTDPRYDSRYSVKGAPFGIALMKDWEGFGVVLTPGLITIGQNYDVVNTEGGHDGVRKITLRYATVPIAFKLHLIDLDFFRVSALASVGANYLLDASDHITHEDTKLKFPSETFPILPEGYVQQYDGVLVPAINKQTISVKEDYNNLQLHAGLGLRSDWDISNHWRVSFDVRVNYVFFDPRQDTYLDRIKAFESLYDTPGARTDLYMSLNVGIARFIEFDKNDKEREKNLKGKKRFVPSKQYKSRRRTSPGNR